MSIRGSLITKTGQADNIGLGRKQASQCRHWDVSVKVFSAALNGIDAVKIDVEVDSSPGLHSFSIVGLPDKSVEESKERLDSAIKNSGFANPKSKNLKVVVNLAPASIRKEGSSFDLPMAIGYLAASSQITLNSRDSDRLFLGELSLDGSLRPIAGVLSVAILAQKKGFSELVLPKANVGEASLVKGLRVVGVENLKELIPYLKGEADVDGKVSDGEKESSTFVPKVLDELDFAYIKGQETAKRALLIAAAGGHNILMFGPPGSGKTILAKALNTILPPLSYEEAIEVTRIYSVAGLTRENSTLLIQRPFRSPHHTISNAGIIGGGNIPRPGEISLAHKGVLFLDELPEFPRNVLEALRQPMEEGFVVVARAAGSSRFPANFMLVASMNPCPCGNFGSETEACTCLPASVLRYQKKISGPLLDRIDLQISVPRGTFSDLTGEKGGKTSTEMRQEVNKARQIQAERLGKYGILANSEIGFKNIHKICVLEPEGESVLGRFVEKNNISGRGYHRLLKVGRTIADLYGHEKITAGDITEAMGYRLKSRES